MVLKNIHISKLVLGLKLKLSHKWSRKIDTFQTAKSKNPLYIPPPSFPGIHDNSIYTAASAKSSPNRHTHTCTQYTHSRC